MRELGVSQVVVSVSKEPPLAAKEVSGTLDELSLMDLGFRDPSVLERPVAEIMSPAIPMIGIGEPVPRIVERLDSSPAVLVLDGGHPVGVLSRSDLLGVPRGEGARVERTGARAAPGFETRAIHAGQDADPATGAVVVPIHLATTFAQDAVGKHRGFEYGRTGNPTRAALESCLASLEGAARGLAFASGMAAEDAVLRTLVGPGDHVVLPDDAYGGTFRLVSKVLAPTGRRLELRDARRRPTRCAPR